MDGEFLKSHWPEMIGHMKEAGYSDGYVGSARRLIAKLIDAMPDLEGWDEARDWVDRTWCSDATRRGMRVHLGHVMRFCEAGELPRGGGAVRHDGPNTRDGLCPGFAAVVDAYEASPEAAAKKESTVRCEVSNASTLLTRLEALGRTALAEVTEDDLIEVLTGPDGKPAFSAGYARHARSAILAAHGVEGHARVASLIPVPKNWRKVGEVLTEAERGEVIEELADAASPLSLRDRAIGCLLVHTGMRASDVAALRLDAIDWERDTITIAQEKTGAILALPLVAQVGNAILDYVARERGGSADPHVFLSTAWPYGPLRARNVSRIAGVVLEAAGVRTRGKSGEARGSHQFRRALASAMMGAGTDSAVVAAALGHSSPGMAERYMVADVEGLRRCALDVSAFPVREGVLSW